MKLILNIPYPLITQLEPYSDAEMIITNMLRNKAYSERWLKEKTKERWLGYIFDPLTPPKTVNELIEYVYLYKPDVVMTPFSHNSTTNVVAVETFKSALQKRELNVKTIARWAGALWEIPILKNMVDTVGIAHVFYRDKVKEEIDTDKCHFLGYKYKDELLRLKPLSVNTSVPLRAAALGIYLRERSRRPKGLPDFNPNQRLNYEEQLALTIANIQYIKEGTEWA